MFEESSFENTAEHYDLFELKSHKMYEYVLEILDESFRKHGVRSVLDVACGTGAQAVPLARKGYQVTACDISQKMLRIARRKARDVTLSFSQGDMRHSRLGRFDAVIAIFNAIGYLSRQDFLTALRNTRENLRPSGVFAFDHTNLHAVRAALLCKEKLIDAAGEHEGTKYVRFIRSTLDLPQGLMTMDWEAHVQHGFEKPEVSRGTWHRQTYTVEELDHLLSEEGFQLLECYDRYGGAFHETETFSVLMVAKRA